MFESGQIAACMKDSKDGQARANLAPPLTDHRVLLETVIADDLKLLTVA